MYASIGSPPSLQQYWVDENDVVLQDVVATTAVSHSDGVKTRTVTEGGELPTTLKITSLFCRRCGRGRAGAAGCTASQLAIVSVQYMWIELRRA